MTTQLSFPPRKVDGRFDDWIIELYRAIRNSSTETGGEFLNVISVDTTIEADTSYIVVGYLDINADLTIDGNLGII